MKSKSWQTQRNNLRQRSSLNIPFVSLLSPHTERRPPTASNGSWVKDIGLDELIDAFGASRRYIPFIRQTLEGLETDISVIAWRQAVFADFMRNSQLVDQIETLLSKLATL
jgi:hypothetical protein